MQNRNGASTSLDTLWTFNLGSFARPMPQINGDKIYAAGWVNVFSIDKQTGNQHWNSQILDDNEIRGKQFLVNGDYVMVNHVDKTYAWDKKTGKKAWEFTYHDTLEIRIVGNHTITPLGFSFNSTKDKAINLDHEGNLHSMFQMTDNFNTNGVEYGEGKLFVGQVLTVNRGYTRGRMSAFDLYSGDSLWSYTTDYNGFSFAPPIYEDGIVYGVTVGNSDSCVAVALNASTGEVIWEYVHDYLWGRALNVGKKHIYVNTGGSLAALDKETGEINCRVEWLGSDWNPPSYLEGYVYHVRDYELLVIDDNSGEILHEEPVPPGGSYFWNVVVSEDKVFAQTSRQLVAYKPWHCVLA